jgi:iron complex outermembrane receptor protein
MVDSVVVSGAPYAVSLDSTTTSVDVLTPEDLARAPAGGLGEVLDGEPGLRSTAYGPGASRPIIRGQSGARVLILQNGVGLVDASALSPDHAVAADPGMASRVEVLRGPSALAYGGGAIGGVVNVIDERIPTSAPADGLEGWARGSYSTVDEGAAGAFGFKAGRGPWVFALDGERRVSDDYQTPVSSISDRLAAAEGLTPLPLRKQLNTDVAVAGYGVGVSRILADGYLGVSARRTTTQYGIPFAQDSAPLAEGPIGISLQQTRFDARGETAANFGPFNRVRFSAGYADYHHAELDRGADGAVGTEFFSEGGEGRLELIQRDRNGWQGAVGFQRLKRNFEAVGDEAFIPPVEIAENGAFLLQRLERGKWGVEGGLRLDRRTLDADLQGRPTSIIAQTFGVDWSAARSNPAFSNLSAAAGAFIRPSEPWFLALAISRNARAPTEFELFSDGPHEGTESYQLGDPTLRSEVVTSVEGTVRYRKQRLRLEGHLYRARYAGYIDEIPTGDVVSDEGDPSDPELPVLRFVQSNATFTGGEIELRYEAVHRPSGSLFLEASADTVRGQTRLGPAARMPPAALTGRVTWEGEKLDAHVEVRRVEAQRRLAANELATDGYTVVNLSAGYRPLPDGDLTIFVDVVNLTDAETREHTSFLKDLAPGAGRSVRLGMSSRF